MCDSYETAALPVMATPSGAPPAPVRRNPPFRLKKRPNILPPTTKERRFPLWPASSGAPPAPALAVRNPHLGQKTAKYRPAGAPDNDFEACVATCYTSPRAASLSVMTKHLNPIVSCMSMSLGGTQRRPTPLFPPEMTFPQNHGGQGTPQSLTSQPRRDLSPHDWQRCQGGLGI